MKQFSCKTLFLVLLVLLNLAYLSDCTSHLTYSFADTITSTSEYPGYNIGSFAVNDTI